MRHGRIFLGALALLVSTGVPLGSATMPRSPHRVAVDIQGRIVHRTRAGAEPVAGILVTYRDAAGTRSVPVISGPTGWYRFGEVAPGMIVIEAWPDGLPRTASDLAITSTATIGASSAPTTIPDLVVP